MKYVTAALLSILAGGAQAAPLNYQFNLGYPTGGAVATVYELILGITVDDGGLGAANRTFFTTDVSGLTATSGTFSLASTGPSSIGTVGPSSAIITTDNNGVGTLGLVTGGTFSAVYFEPNSYTSISLGNGNNTTVNVYYSGTTTSVSYSGPRSVAAIQAGGTSAVPLPAGGMLLATGLAILGFARRRKATLDCLQAT